MVGDYPLLNIINQLLSTQQHKRYYILSVISKISGALRSQKELSAFNKAKAVSLPKIETHEYSDQELSDSFFLTKVQPLNEALSIADEVLYRTCGKRFFENQMAGAYLLSEGNFIEMMTGEGKTLVFSLSAAILAKRNKSLVTVVTANDYLAERDYLSNKSFFDALGIKSAFITGRTSKKERLDYYKVDVLYTTLRETAYDYLRDEKCLSKCDINTPIRDILFVDEADNVLIDNAAHPYTLSETIKVDERLTVAAHNFSVQSKVSKDENTENYQLSEDGTNLTLSQKGIEKLEEFLVKHQFLETASDLYKDDKLYLIELFEGAGVAIHIMKEGTEYIVSDSGIVILDKNSGRPLSGVSLSKGLQQILEYDKGINLSEEGIPSSSISTESIVSLFNTVAGMSGTLKVEEDELSAVYKRGCISIPCNKKTIRKDHDDVFFLSKTEKARYTLERISSAYQKRQPVLIATANESEALGMKNALNEMNIKSELLTSSSLNEEAAIVALAGVAGRVTISTGVVGRGTDIILGGNLEHFIENKLIENNKIPESIKEQEESRKQAIEAGGLLVIGFGRQLIRKLDLQLIGRSGRQGDPGESIFVSSLDDGMLGEYGPKLKSFLSKMNIKETDMLSHSSITKALDNAQRGFRDRILKSRKTNSALSSQLEEQRRIIYDMRMNILSTGDDDFTENLQKNIGINNIRSDINKENILQVFDDILFSYQSSVDDLKRSIFFQSLANKNPMQEIKQKSFLEYELLMNRFIKEITFDE
jgi:preprotein translocase subunit SecA